MNARQSSSRSVLFTACVSLCLPLWASARATTIPLDQAVATGKVQVRIVALGGSSGDTMEIVLRRQIAQSLELTVRPGTVLTTSSGSVQRMAAAAVKGERAGPTSYRPSPTMVLDDDSEHHFFLEAYCLDMDKDNPAEGQLFVVAAPHSRAAQILAAGKKSQAPLEVFQSALWIDLEKASDAQIRARIDVTDEDLRQAHALLQTLDPSAGPQSAPQLRNLR